MKGLACTQVLDCTTWDTTSVTPEQFFRGLQAGDLQLGMLKLRDFPPSEAFSAALPRHNQARPARPC